MITKTAVFHPIESEWRLAPDFTVMTLPGNAPIADALDIILDAKQKKLSLIERQILTSNIEQLAKGNTIKDLNNLSEKE